MQVIEILGQIPDGSYQAFAGGYVSEFMVQGVVLKAKFENGVRGINIKDTVTVVNNEISSRVLGKNGKLL